MSSADESFDLVADWADQLERQVLGVGQMPGEPANAGSDRGDLFAASRDGDVGPGERLGVELAREVVARVEANLR
jgi:hypothetical protein